MPFGKSLMGRGERTLGDIIDNVVKRDKDLYDNSPATVRCPSCGTSFTSSTGGLCNSKENNPKDASEEQAKAVP